ncbi:MAG: lysylphosphatidylglycerol synthase transmembrane domain-containing protein [Bacteroidota bacterium]
MAEMYKIDLKYYLYLPQSNFEVNKRIQNILKFFVFLGIGAVLLWLVYKDQDIGDLFARMRNIRWIWFVPALAIALLSHVSRAMRWNLLLESMGNYKPRLSNTFFAVMTMYFVNLAIPRLGEVTRSGIVSRYDKLPFSKVLGTMVTERATDIIMLLLITIVVMITKGSEVTNFIMNNPGFKENLHFLFSPVFWIIFVLVSLAVLFLLYSVAKGKLDNYKVFKKTGNFLRNFFSGIKAVLRLRNPWKYIGHSLFIFLAYFLMLYLCFPAFDGMENIDIFAALTIFAAGSFGMVAPAPNGMGAWHFMTIQTLLIFGVLEADAKLFALVVHGLQTIMLVVVGLISVIGLPLINRNRL